MGFELERPDQLDDDAWDAIESYRQRLETASGLSDRPLVIGASKDLIECVARVVLDAAGHSMGDSAKFPALVSEAQTALGRVAGKNIGGDPDVRTIASSALKIAVGVNAIRNDVGAGHGRAVVGDIDDEMLSIVVDATLLWARWALRRLGHVLAGEPQKLIAELHGSTNKRQLARHFEAVLLGSQPPDIQRALGVAFGQEAGGGFFIAREVGVLGALESDNLTDWPVEYRLGLVDGLVIDRTGHIGLVEHYASAVADLLVPVPPREVSLSLGELSEKVRAATWISHWRWSNLDPHAVVASLRRQVPRLERRSREALGGLAEALSAAADPNGSTTDE